MNFTEEGVVDKFAEFDHDNRMHLEVHGAARFRVCGDRFFVLDGASGLWALYFDLQRLVLPRKYGPIYAGEIVSIGPKTVTLRNVTPGSNPTEMTLRRID